MAEAKDVLLPDAMVILPYFPQQLSHVEYAEAKRHAIETLRGLEPGVTELICHPAVPTKEVKAALPTWPLRAYEWELLRDEEIRDMIRSERIQLMRWRELRALQRSAVKARVAP